MKRSYLALAYTILTVLLPYNAEAAKTSTKRGSSSYADLLFFSLTGPGDLYRVEESFSYVNGQCLYVVDSYRPGNQSDVERETKRSQVARMSQCFASYKAKNDVCNVISEYDDIITEVPYFRCFSYPDSLANNGWEVVRNQLSGAWKMVTANDVRIQPTSVLSDTIEQIDPELSKLNRKGIRCKFEMVGTSADERNMVAREMFVSRVLMKRDHDQADVRYEISETNAVTGKQEVAKALVCKVPHEFRFTDRSEFNLKKKEIDTTFNLKQILKDVGIELVTPEEKSI